MEKAVFFLDPKDPKLILISKSKNKPGAPVFREPLPSVLFNRAPRVILGSTWFDKYTKNRNPLLCEGCHSKKPTDRHELYGLYKFEGNYIIKLEGVMCLCRDCHQKIHGGFSDRMSMKTGHLLDQAPYSDALSAKKYPWNEAKFILIEGALYRL